MYRGFGGQQRNNRFEQSSNFGGRDNRSGGGGRFGQNDRFNSNRGRASSNRGGNNGSFRGGNTGSQPPSRDDNGKPSVGGGPGSLSGSGGGQTPSVGGAPAAGGATIPTFGAANAPAGRNNAPSGATGAIAVAATNASKPVSGPSGASGSATGPQSAGAASPSTANPRPGAPVSSVVNANQNRGGNAPVGSSNSAACGGGNAGKVEPPKRDAPESKPTPQQLTSPARAQQAQQNQHQSGNQQQQQRGGNIQHQQQRGNQQQQQQQRGGHNNSQQRGNQQLQHKSDNSSFEDSKTGGADAMQGQLKEEEEEEAEKVPEQRKFTGRCRLFVGNMPNDTTEEDFVKMFEQFGETSESFLNAARGFGFIRLDTRHNAENARRALDGVMRRGRPLRVRFAAHGAALRVKYLSQHVSNEMLEQTFSMFGDVERAVVVVDDRGRPNGEGIVEFARKPGALAALKRISEGVFLMTSSLRPIMVEPLEDKDENDGLPEIFFQQTAELVKERELPPRFAAPNSVEFEFGQKWKTLYQMYKEREDLLKRNFEEEAAKLDMDQETAKLEQHANMLRQDLMRRQEELRRLEEQTQKEVQRRLEQRMMEEERRRKELELLDARRRGMGDMFQQQQIHQNMQQQQQQSMQPQQPQQQQHPSLQQQVQQHQQEWQQQQLLQQQQLQQMRGGGGEQRGGLPPTPMQPPPIPPGMDAQRARAQGINVIGGGGGGPGQPIGAAMAVGGNAIPSLVQQDLGQAQQGNLRQIKFDPQPGMGPNGGGGGMAREIGAKAGPGMAGGREEYFDPKRARRY